LRAMVKSAVSSSGGWLPGGSLTVIPRMLA
jgi:hypothetical protein